MVSAMREGVVSEPLRAGYCAVQPKVSKLFTINGGATP